MLPSVANEIADSEESESRDCLGTGNFLGDSPVIK